MIFTLKSFQNGLLLEILNFLPDRNRGSEVEEGQQQECLSYTDGWHHEVDENDDFLRRKMYLSSILKCTFMK